MSDTTIRSEGAEPGAASHAVRRVVVAVSVVVAAVVTVGTGLSAMAARATVVGAAARRPSSAHPPVAEPPAADPPVAAASEPGAATPPHATNPAAPGLVVSSGQDESDPFLYLTQGRYFLYTSGMPGPPAVNVPVASATSFAQWGPVTDALPALPRWAVPGFTWAPDVQRFGSAYVLYFTAMVAGTSPAMECIGDATGTRPDGPFTPIDAPFICQAAMGGSIDPRVFTDADGTTWMVWKSDQNIGGANTPTKMWSQRLSGDGLTLLGQPADIQQPDQPWQGTIVEAPDLVDVGGTYWDFYSGNWFNQPAYAIGAARCQGPEGPCSDSSAWPLLASNDQGQGPGEASIFADSSGVWMLYSPRRSFAPLPDIPPRPVDITRLGFTAAGPYLAAGGPPPSVAVLGAGTLWSAPQTP
jgi:hypothetical protein